MEALGKRILYFLNFPHSWQQIEISVVGDGKIMSNKTK